MDRLPKIGGITIERRGKADPNKGTSTKSNQAIAFPQGIAVQPPKTGFQQNRGPPAQSPFYLKPTSNQSHGFKPGPSKVPPSPSKAVLPQGVTLKRKQPVSPGFQLPPGISLAKNMKNAPQAPSVPPAPGKTSLRSVRPQRNHPVPPVQPPSPRPRMNIGSFLEQGMEVGNAPLALPRSPQLARPRFPSPRPTLNFPTNLNRPVSSVSPRLNTWASGVQQPPKISVPPGILVERRKSDTSNPAIKIPAGISIEKKNPAASQQKPTAGSGPTAVQRSNLQLNTNNQQKTVKEDFNNRTSHTQAVQLDLEDEDSDEHVDDDEYVGVEENDDYSGEFDDDDVPLDQLKRMENVKKAPPNVALPPGISFGKQNYDQNEEVSDDQLDEESESDLPLKEIMKKAPLLKDEVKKAPSGVQLPPGISFGKQTYDQNEEYFDEAEEEEPEPEPPAKEIGKKTPVSKEELKKPPPGIRLPPGISFGKQNYDEPEEYSDEPVEEETQLPFKAEVKQVPAVKGEVKNSPASKEEIKKPPPGIQLPPGISFGKQTYDQDEEYSDEIVDEEEEPEPEPPAKKEVKNIPTFKEEVKTPSGIQLPPGISFGKQTYDDHEPEGYYDETVGEDEHETDQSFEEEVKEDYPVRQEVTKAPPAVQLPPGISFGKQSYDNNSEDYSDEHVEEEEEPEPPLKEAEDTSSPKGDVKNAPPGIQLPPGISFGKQTYDDHDSEEYSDEHVDGEEAEPEPLKQEIVKKVPTGVQLPPGVSFGKQSYDQHQAAADEGPEEEEEIEPEPPAKKVPPGIQLPPGISFGKQSYDEEEGEEDPNSDEIHGEDDGHYSNEDAQDQSREEENSQADELMDEDVADNHGEPQEDSFEKEDGENQEFVEEGEEDAIDEERENELLGGDEDGGHEAMMEGETPMDEGEERSEEMDESEEKDVVKDLMELMSKGEIEGEIEEDKDEEAEENKSAEKRKCEEEEEGEVPAKKMKSRDDEDDSVDDESNAEDIDKSKVSSAHLRKNIREVMDETKLDETTLAAQREEAERLKRLQEQQRILREVKKQIQMNKMAEKMQSSSSNVLSLLRGNSEMSILKKSSLSNAAATATPRVSNSVLLKTGSGQQACLSDKMRELLASSGKAAADEQSTKNLVKQGMLSSSVTIAPVKKELMYDEQKKKKGDVVTLSSDSDDDCIVLSEDEIESEPDEDPTNSGMHTSDKYNLPDEHGRVLINTGHPPEETDIFLAPQISRVIKPHQVGGVRFLYDNIIESTARYESSTGFGCILAHSMGLGKTLQIVSFSDVFLRHTSGRKILCIMPINTIQNWQAEYNMWLPKECPEGADVRCRDFNVYIVNESCKNIQMRAKVILEWEKTGGVLLMGYELFRLLSLKKPVKSKRKRPNEEENERNRNLVEEIYAALVKPGPDLVICDEGHRIKNSHATTSQALKQIRTKRRVVLTGYPLQNNLLEYWCMVDFVRPNYLGSKTEFSNMFERPIQNGQCIDSTPQDKRLMRYRAHVLHSLLEGFVQRRSHAVLQDVLPHKEEYVLMLRFTPFQKKLYDTFMNDVVRTVAVPNPLKAFAVCCKIWNHPDVLYNFLKKKGEQRDLELEDPLPPTSIPMPPRFGMDGAAPTFPPVNPLPRRGPGSRGGKVRNSKRGALHQAAPVSDKATSSGTPLPSFGRFPVQNNSYRSDSRFSSTSTTSSSNFQQPMQSNNYAQQQSNSYFPSYDESDNQNMYNNSQQMYSNNQNTGMSQDVNSSNYLRGQDQYSNYGSSSTGSQFYPNNAGFDFNNSGGGEMGEFSSMTGFGDNNFDNPGFGDFQQNSGYWGSTGGWNNSGGQAGYAGGDEFTKKSDFGMFGGKEDSNVQQTDNKMAPTKFETDERKDDREIKAESSKKDEVPYDWATDLFKNYVTGVVENSSKMAVFMLILQESISQHDRMLVFSQSLLTLDLIEEYLQRRLVPGQQEYWAKNKNYFRLDGSTPALEREKLINDFNGNDMSKLFLVSTRAGSLGINLVGANRVVVFDASWNPCHDTQAVCRVYRYGQKKPCYVYRLVMDCCLEKKIYDRQINKQGMADRVVDELNPDAHLSIKEVTNLCWDDQEQTTVKDFSNLQDKYKDRIVKLLLANHSALLSKAPFQHESLLIDRKEKKLSQAEKRLAKRSYELEKQQANQPRSNLYQMFPQSSGMRTLQKPIASVKPMQSDRFGVMPSRSKWIPAEVWQKQGMSAQEMTLPLDVVIPTNSPDKTSIVLKAGQRVMVLKSPKGIYMQLESGKIIAIRTAFKVGQEKGDDKKVTQIASALKNNPDVTITPPKSSRTLLKTPASAFFKSQSSLDKRAAAVNMAATKGRVAVNLKNRPTPTIVRKNIANDPKAIAANATKSSTIVKDVSEDKCKDGSSMKEGSIEHKSETASMVESLKTDLESLPTTAYPEQGANPDSGMKSTGESSADSDLGWDNVSMDSGFVKESLDTLSSMAKEPPASESIVEQPKQDPAYSQSPMKEEIKKEEGANPAWPKGPYPMDPYGNYYPGYPGYYGPMPGYEGYPYHLNPYPPPPIPPVKTESPQDGSAPHPPAAPPMYPPYPSPYPYPPYNRTKTEPQDGSTPPAAPHMYPPYPSPYPYPPYSSPHFPPQPAPSTTTKSTDQSETPTPPQTYPPPFGGPPRPPFPAPPTGTPGYYPNYPPYRPPFHDPNYPYPNYNPYMPPGYGYPPHAMPPQPNADGSSQNPGSQGPETSSQ